LTDFIQILQMFIIWGNDNLSKILGKWKGCPDHFLRIDMEWP